MSESTVTYRIKVDTSVPPVLVPTRNQPAPLRDRLRVTLNGMETQGVIRRVDEPIQWVNSLVVMKIQTQKS